MAELVESLKADVLKVIENMEEAALKISQLSIENAALRSFSNDLEENNINLSKSNDDLDFKIKERESRLSTWERIICESLKPFHDLMEKDEKVEQLFFENPLQKSITCPPFFSSAPQLPSSRHLNALSKSYLEKGH